MDRETELVIIRRAYAKQVLAAAGVSDTRLENAYATVRREHFLGPGPWPFFRWLSKYVPTPDDDPVYLYTDDLVGLLPDRLINNGQPSLHATLMARASVQEGEHIVHVGAGVGYYTAILAHLAGATGHVTGIELEAALAARARSNFDGVPNVEIIEGDGAVAPFATANVIYVNAGATHPAPAWLDRLADGGRLILPLTADVSRKHGVQLPGSIRCGAVFRIERKADEYWVQWISPVAIFPCVGARDPAAEAGLAAAFENSGAQNVTRLYRTEEVPTERCWVRGQGWCLAYS